jgi:hypothetical protein
MARSKELARDTRTASIAFLKIELTTGLNFAKAATEFEEGSDKRSNVANARKAYDTITRRCFRSTASEAVRIDTQELEPEFTELRKLLAELGEAV